MKFVIYREAEGKRKTLIEWKQDEILVEIEKELEGAGNALSNVIEKFKKETITIP